MYFLVGDSLALVIASDSAMVWGEGRGCAAGPRFSLACGARGGGCICIYAVPALRSAKFRRVSRQNEFYLSTEMLLLYPGALQLTTSSVTIILYNTRAV